MSESRRKDQDYLLSNQYKNAGNLRARMALHERFSTNKEDLARWVFDHIEAPEDARVLELGCGPANFWAKNRERIPQGWHVTLIDLSPGMLEEAKKATETLDATFDYRVADAQTIPFEDSTFDLVVANHMLYHVPDELKALADIRRVLKPGGRLYAATNGLEHMMELQTFITEQFGEFGTSLSLDPQAFQLENGAEKLSRFFDAVDLHIVENNALKVTEAEPFMAYILSMQRFQDASQGVSEEVVQRVIDEAHAEAEKRLEHGPIHITKATGLFVAS